MEGFIISHCLWMIKLSQGIISNEKNAIAGLGRNAIGTDGVGQFHRVFARYWDPRKTDNTIIG